MLKNVEIKKNVRIFSHRGFGEKAHARYDDRVNPRYVHNQLSGLELGIEHGADTLELDLSKTADGKIVTAHGIPFQKTLSVTEQEYLQKTPEALTMQELLDWLHHQPIDINLYLELKSPLTIQELLLEFKKYCGGNQKMLNTFYNQLLFYTHDLSAVTRLLDEKQNLGLSTEQLRLCWVAMKFITTIDIDVITKLGSQQCRIYGVEQGTVPWGFQPFVSLMRIPLPPFAQIMNRLKNMHDSITYAHQNNLQFFVGTVDNVQIIKILLDQGIDGLVPNNPSYVFKALGIETPQIAQGALNYYIPTTMRRRINIKEK